MPRDWHHPVGWNVACASCTLSCHSPWLPPLATLTIPATGNWFGSVQYLTLYPELCCFCLWCSMSDPRHVEKSLAAPGAFRSRSVNCSGAAYSAPSKGPDFGSLVFCPLLESTPSSSWVFLSPPPLQSPSAMSQKNFTTAMQDFMEHLATLVVDWLQGPWMRPHIPLKNPYMIYLRP